MNFSSSLEEKVDVAWALLRHADQYEPIVDGAASREAAKARQFQRQEREKAATLMREAGADYTKKMDKAKAREIYQTIIERYPEEEYRHIREAAATSLKELDSP